MWLRGALWAKIHFIDFERKKRSDPRCWHPEMGRILNRQYMAMVVRMLGRNRLSSGTPESGCTVLSSGSPCYVGTMASSLNFPTCKTVVILFTLNEVMYTNVLNKP